MTLADSILGRPGPLADLLLADPDAPSPVPEGRAVRNTIPIILADAVASDGCADERGGGRPRAIAP